MSKLFLLGLDGATFDLLGPMVDRGELPAFASLMQTGAYGTLRSTIPPLSPPAWVSLATGKNPGKHGVVGFTRFVPRDYQRVLLCGRDSRATPIWDLVGPRGSKVIVVNVPMTYPPTPVNGLLISGLDAPGLHADFTYPPGLKQEILRVSPAYSINLHLGGYLRNERRRRKGLRMLLNAIDARYSLVRHLMRAHDWDFFFAKFNNPDIAQHHFWKYLVPDGQAGHVRTGNEVQDAIFTVYQRLDRILAELLEVLGSEVALAVVSDHGAGPRVGKAFLVNEWLQSIGKLEWAAPAGDRASRPSLGPAGRNVTTKVLRTLFHWCSPRLRQALKKRLPRLFGRASVFLKFSGDLTEIDWSRTSAFLAEENCIRIHREAEYAHGRVSDTQYHAVVDRIVTGLKEQRDPETGEPVFDTVLCRDEVVHGPHAAELPDIFLVTKDGQYDLSGRACPGAAGPSFLANDTHLRGASGTHRPDGIFFLRSPHTVSGRGPLAVDIVDVAPTLLYQLGLPVPSDMDGRVVSEAFDSQFFEGNRPQCAEVAEKMVAESPEAGPHYTQDESGRMIDHLRELGYLE